LHVGFPDREGKSIPGVSVKHVPAFPNVEASVDPRTGNQIDYITTPGLSRRDYLAAAAFPHVLNNFRFYPGGPRAVETAEQAAKYAVLIADHLELELSKEKK